MFGLFKVLSLVFSAGALALLAEIFSVRGVHAVTAIFPSVQSAVGVINKAVFIASFGSAPRP
jgi:hypothetical protein